MATERGKASPATSSAKSPELPGWDKIMAPILALHKKVKGTTPNPVFAKTSPTSAMNLYADYFVLTVNPSPVEIIFAFPSFYVSLRVNYACN